MKLLLLGATGLAGQAFTRAAFVRQIELRTVSRYGADISCDISNGEELNGVLENEDPDIVVNSVALVNINACEADPGLSWRTNARPAGILAEWSQRTGRAFLQISTDHFFPEGGRTPHDEEAPVTLLNEYARTKFAGEALALTANEALVLRTSIVGFRNWQSPSFAEWAIAAVSEDREMQLFHDAWTSSIDTASFAANALKLLLDRGARGRVNLAASEVYSKEAFIREIALQLNKTLTRATSVSVHDQLSGRAGCLGLDVSRAEKLLSHKLPNLSQVVANILTEQKLMRNS